MSTWMSGSVVYDDRAELDALRDGNAFNALTHDPACRCYLCEDRAAARRLGTDTAADDWQPDRPTPEELRAEQGDRWSRATPPVVRDATRPAQAA